MSNPPQDGDAPARCYRCAVCAREVTYGTGRPGLYPFCSERCRLVDLGKWLRGQYSIDRDLTPEDLGRIEPSEGAEGESQGER